MISPSALASASSNCKLYFFMAATEDSLVRSYDHNIRLPVFEGPLDLLLFLIRKNEVDIYDIPVEKVLKQYLEVLRSMERLQLEVAGEFFVMAATLMYIKSRLLLPKEQQSVEEETTEEDVDPRWELVQQLLEYRKFKDAADSLGDLVESAQNSLPRLCDGLFGPPPQRPIRPADRIELWNVFNQVLRRLAEKIVVGQIHDEVVTVADRMETILKRLKHQDTFLFSELFENGVPRSLPYLISTFLAFLELTRLRHITLEQEGNFADIRCHKCTDEGGLFSGGHGGLSSEFDQSTEDQVGS